MSAEKQMKADELPTMYIVSKTNLGKLKSNVLCLLADYLEFLENECGEYEADEKRDDVNSIISMFNYIEENSKMDPETLLKIWGEL